MKLRLPRRGSLARQFALAAAALTAIALLLTTAASFWLVKEQHTEALHALSRKELDFNAAKLGGALHGIAQHLSDVSDNSILATALVDSAGKEAYLTPYLASLRQINGIPVRILFTDFEGKDIADNGQSDFSAAERAWLKARLDGGTEGSAIFDGPDGPQLVAVELLSYSRTQSPEGALLYKIAIRDLEALVSGRLLWSGQAAPVQAAPVQAASENTPERALDLPARYRPLRLRLLDGNAAGPAEDLTPPYLIVLVITLSSTAAVLLVGSRLSILLTRDLRRLETFAAGIVASGHGGQRAPIGGSVEIASLGKAINHMLDRLYEQHAQLEQESEKLKLLVDTIPHLAWMANPDGWIHWYNNRWYEYTGTTPEDMEGWGWQSVHDPKRLPEVMERWKASIATGKPFELSFPLRGADGTYRTFFTRAAPLRDATGNIVQWFGTNTDVSPLEQAEKAVRVSEERLREGLIAARMTVWEWNLLTDRTTFSSNVQQVLGASWETAEAAWQWLHHEDVESLRAHIDRAVAEHGHYETVVRLIRPDNAELIWLEVRGKVEVDGDGKPCAIRGIALDITERKRAEEDLRVADRRKDEFLAMLAHELRNPLAPIRNAAHILKLVPSNEPHIKKTSEIIARQVEHMTGLIDDLLDVSRVTRGLVTLDKETHEITAIVAGAIEQVRILVDARRQRMTTRLAPEPVHVYGDKTRLVQVLTNLIHNSVKFTPDGGAILLDVDATADEVRIAVRDNGVGISPDLLPHVFELFTQGERSPDRSQGGLGLGLALVKSLVELHGGGVSARSEGPGRGSEFVVRLPRAQVDTEAEAGRSPQEESGGTALSILVVDDNVDAADTLALMLRADGHSVAVEYNAADALRRAREERPRVMLLDIGLPDEDGNTLARKLRSLPETRGALLIALTGYGQREDRDRSREAGFDHHLVKPADPVELKRLLSQVRSGAESAV